jgi:RNA polymerase sigma factor (sigma-70 family)
MPVPFHDDPVRFALDFDKIPASIKAIANQIRRLGHVQYESDSPKSALALEDAPSLSESIETWIAQEEARAKMRDVFPKLTRREQEVVVLQAEGFSQRAIANALSISSGTVSVYLDRARKRASGQLPPDRRWRKFNNLPQRKKS